MAFQRFRFSAFNMAAFPISALYLVAFPISALYLAAFQRFSVSVFQRLIWLLSQFLLLALSPMPPNETLDTPAARGPEVFLNAEAQRLSAA